MCLHVLARNIFLPFPFVNLNRMLKKHYGIVCLTQIWSFFVFTNCKKP